MLSPLGKALGRDVTVKGFLEIHKAAFLAPGLWAGRQLDLPGMDASTVSDALGFLVACTSVFDDQGRFSPCFDESKPMELDFDQIIQAVGQTVEAGLVEYLKREFGTDGLLEVEEETLQVKGRPGLFAGGDIIRGAGTVVEAVADGRRAAGAIDSVIRGTRPMKMPEAVASGLVGHTGRDGWRI